ncbi:MAG: spore coat protein CotJB [Clostridium celatum]|jgi:spore coat protein JB|uniref:spore coat protein CotJB n=1 Tax=Clostridium sp. TaxID=1506 RepID=UPI002707C569|nr:spore coat protein CotJB [Clostridium sp.]MDU4883249.1 spore coat protein CotJB [Clostridium celatum]MDU5262629.1 spore coat protein CotJB [Clostridium celatum]
MNQRECLDAIRKLQFFAIDLNLYLDNFPNCKDAIDDYKLISSKLRKLMWDYEQSYGPLSNFGSAYIQNPDAWIDTPWPWENESNRED